MIIDFHTHIFPDEIAPKAFKGLAESVKHIIKPSSDMTLNGLLANMDDAGIDLSVVQPVVTKQSQTCSVNNWAQKIKSERIISFGGIYPHSDDYKRDIDYVVSLGLKGLKFHPEYQSFILDDERMLRIYDYAINKGLILMFHAGDDPGMPPPYKSSPKQFSNISAALGGGTIIAAHLGGYKQWDEVENFIVGTNIYIDTSMGFEHYSKEQFLRIVKEHGADKILFASDSPWSFAKKEIQVLNSLPLSNSEKAKILGLNAKKLLGL